MKKQLNHIMCVDDDLDILEIINLSLGMFANYKVTTFTNGLQALEQVNLIKPDFILLDVMMPEIDGPSLLKKIKETIIDKTVPIVFMTARIQPHEIAEYIDLGAVGAFAKPFDPMKLPHQVCDIWHKAHEQAVCGV